MSVMTQKRSRILHVRKIEHRVATAKLFQANRDLAKMVNVQERIGTLQANTQIGCGGHTGPVLRATGEMQQRLSDAYDALAHSKTEAEERKQETEQLRNAAHQREERAQRLYDHAKKNDMLESVRRHDANMPSRQKFKKIG